MRTLNAMFDIEELQFMIEKVLFHITQIGLKPALHNTFDVYYAEA